MRAILDVVMLVLQLYVYVLIASAIMSWLVAFNVVNTRNNVVSAIWDFLHRVTEPVLRPIRNVLPNLGGIDVSPIILLLIIFFIQRVIQLYLYPAVFKAVSGEPWRVSATGLELRVRLTPRGGRDVLEGIEALSDGSRVLKARVRAAPENGAANAALCRLVAGALGRPGDAVRHAARLKTLRIRGDGPSLAATLARLAGDSA